jgi:hypothetical protein
MRVGDDMYFDPAQVAIGFARGAEARGVTLLPSTAVTSVRIASGRVEAVETDKGMDASNCGGERLSHHAGADNAAAHGDGGGSGCAARPANGTHHGCGGVPASVPRRVLDSGAKRKRGEKRDELAARELARNNDLAIGVDGVDLKDPLRQIQTDPRDSSKIPDRLAHGRLPFR